MNEEGIQLLEEILISFKFMLEDYQVDEILASATAALRQANRDESLKRMKKKTGFTSIYYQKRKKRILVFLQSCIPSLLSSADLMTSI